MDWNNDILKKARSKADDIYYAKMIEGGLFEKAHELFPNSNDPDSEDLVNAIDYMLDQVDADSLDQETRDKLYSMVEAGLT